MSKFKNGYSSISGYEEVADHVNQLTTDIISTKQVLSTTNWDALLNFLEPKDAVIVSNFKDKCPAYSQIVQNNSLSLQRILFESLNKCRNKNTLRSFVAIIIKIVKEVPSFIDDLYNFYVSSNFKYPLSPLFTLLRPENNEDAYIFSTTCRILTMLLTNFPEIQEGDKKAFFVYLINILDIGMKVYSDSIPFTLRQSVALSSLRQLLKKSDIRTYFFELNGLNVLCAHIVLPKAGNVTAQGLQLLYETLFNVWLMSFNKEIAVRMNNPELISDLCKIVAVIKKEKIVRITLSLLTNLLEYGQNDALMISYGLMRCLELLSGSNLADPDMAQNVEILKSSLEKKVNDLSSFTIYKNEVMAHALNPSSPTHRSEKFWKSNISKFEQNDFEVIHELMNILKNKSLDPVIISLACWDLGEIVRLHPQKQFLLKKVDIKTSIFNLLKDPNPEISKEALLALQKIMIFNWQKLSN